MNAAPFTVTKFIPKHVSEGLDASETAPTPENGNDQVRAPRPLLKRAAPPSLYPIDALGDVLADAARAIADKVQCAHAMAAQSVLAVASLAAQALADVKLPYGQTRPLSLYFLTIAASGDRKSSADNEAIAPVRMHEAKLREAFEPIAQARAIDSAAWRAQRTQIDRDKSNFEQRRAKLSELGPEPDPPLHPILTIGESTAEGLAKHMPGLPGALGIFSAEGGQFLSGHGFTAEAKMRTAASFASLWDGAGLRRLRAGDGLIDLRGRRLAAHLMIQPEAAAGVLGDPVLRDQGLLSRLLITAPESLAGNRLWQEPRAGTELALRRYIARILRIFEEPIAAANERGNELTPRPLELSSEARVIWTEFHDEVERDLRPTGRLAELRDVGGKAAEQAGRIAGVLAIVENRHADMIDDNSMRRACKIARFHLDEARRMADEAHIPPEVADAQTLLQWIQDRRFRLFIASVIQKSGPNQLRRKDKLDPAIRELESAGWLIADKGRTWRVCQTEPQ